MEKTIAETLEMKHFAIFGASNRKNSNGYKIFKKLHENGYKVYPISPRLVDIDGVRCFGTIEEIPFVPQVVCIATPAEICYDIVKGAYDHGVRRFWIEPESCSEESLAFIARHELPAVCTENLCDVLEA
ncbi:MAG: CoA-binding protein [Candidatus Sumerlaeia bacterium]